MKTRIMFILMSIGGILSLVSLLKSQTSAPIVSATLGILLFYKTVIISSNRKNTIYLWYTILYIVLSGSILYLTLTNNLNKQLSDKSPRGFLILTLLFVFIFAYLAYTYYIPKNLKETLKKIILFKK